MFFCCDDYFNKVVIAIVQVGNTDKCSHESYSFQGEDMPILLLVVGCYCMFSYRKTRPLLFALKVQ